MVDSCGGRYGLGVLCMDKSGTEISENVIDNCYMDIIFPLLIAAKVVVGFGRWSASYISSSVKEAI